MSETSNETIDHHAYLGTGNGVIQFVCCTGDEHPFDMLWQAPGGQWGANIFHTPRQAYDAVVRHLTRGRADDPTVAPILDAAATLFGPAGDARLGIQYLASHLGTIDLDVSTQ